MTSTFYDIIPITGTDRQAFLQAQLTQDLRMLAEHVCLPAAWCNAKGRVLVTCRLLDFGEMIGMALPASLRASVTARLSLYRLRAKVEFLPDGEWRAAAVCGDDALRRLADLRLLPASTSGTSLRTNGVTAVRQFGLRDYVELYGRNADLRALGLEAADLLGDAAWQQQRIASGRVDISAANTELYTPHMLNLDLTGSVSFSKGCYPGQEIVARTEHLGTVKRRINRYALVDCTAAIGDKLTDGESDVGEVVNAAGGEILAIAPVARHGDTLRLGTGTAVPQPLPYAIP